MMKICSRCKEEKNENDQFSWRNQALGRKDNWCKDCRKEYDSTTRAERYKDNRLRDIAQIHNNKYGGQLTADQLQKCLDFFDNCDAYTGQKFVDGGTKSERMKNMLVFSHVVLVSQGGVNEIGNIVPTTRRNNSRKSNMANDTFMLSIPEPQMSMIRRWAEVCNKSVTSL